MKKVQEKWKGKTHPIIDQIYKFNNETNIGVDKEGHISCIMVTLEDQLIILYPFQTSIFPLGIENINKFCNLE